MLRSKTAIKNYKLKIYKTNIKLVLAYVGDTRMLSKAGVEENPRVVGTI